MRLFRRTSITEQVAEPAVSPEPDFPEISTSDDPTFQVQHNELDDIEERLERLESAEPILLEAPSRFQDGIVPSAGRVNELDLRNVIALGDDEDDDDRDVDFERRFSAFANHVDERAPSWMD